MKRFSILAITLCAFCGSVSAQQALFGGQMPQSPEIHADSPLFPPPDNMFQMKFFLKLLDEETY